MSQKKSKKIKDLNLVELYEGLDDMQLHLRGKHKQILINHFAYYVAKFEKRTLKKSYFYGESFYKNKGNNEENNRSNT